MNLIASKIKELHHVVIKLIKMEEDSFIVIVQSVE